MHNLALHSHLFYRRGRLLHDNGPSSHCRVYVRGMPEYLDINELIMGKAPESSSCTQHSGDGDTLYSLGVQALKSGQYDSAVDYFRRAIKVDPEKAEFYLLLGITYKELKGLEEAIPYFQQAHSLDPDNPEACYQLGLAYSLLARFAEAIALQLRATAIRPEHAEAHNNLGYCYLSTGQAEAALHAFRQAITAKPHYARAHFNLALACMAIGDLEQAKVRFEETLAIQPDLAVAHDSYLLLLQYLENCSPPEKLIAARRYANQFESPLRPKWPRHGNSVDPERRLKIGYVSPDFNNHAVSRFVLPLFTCHDKAKFEIFAYYNGTKQDTVTAQLRDHVDNWILCANVPDERLAELIRTDGIDILVDLAGHTAGNRLLVFARKPAPVQVSYLGYPSTTGLSSIDWRVVTAETDPVGSERWHTERLWRLQRSLWCYRPATAAPAVQIEAPARRRGYITFGSMNNIAKVSDATVRTWSAVLKAVPGSRLVMTNVATAAADRMRERFVRCGVERNRLQLEGRLETGAYRELLAQVDVALDPYPYNGTTTTCEVLWEGIPVVSLKGEASVSRSGYALLKLIGLEELVGESEEEYIAIASSLASNLDGLERIRQRLRARVEASALRDEAGFTREMEAAYRNMWRAWCSDR